MNLLFFVLLPALCLGQFDPNNGGGPIVHLFEWTWNDIASECENFLSMHNYGGVQISPPNDYVIIDDSSYSRPWWEVYQPVSYVLESRFGSESEFSDMVKRCNDVGIRIYVDAVINHMSGYGNPSNLQSTAGSTFDGAGQSYPDFSASSFNDDVCSTVSGSIEDFQDAAQVRDCKLYGLNDLKLSDPAVQATVVGYLNHLIELGAAGFRVDAAKHMWPADLLAIYDSLDDLNSAFFPAGARPFIYQEVIDLGGEAVSASEYFDMGRVTEFQYSAKIGDIFRGRNSMQLKDLANFNELMGFIPDDSALVFVDNHDNQRGHGAGGDTILTYKDGSTYTKAVAFTLAWPYGYDRLMSSFDFEDTEVGPPMDVDQNIVGPTFNADGSCAGGWICEHRWPAIYRMVDFSDVVKGTLVENWWDNGANQIAFSRGQNGFIAINNEDNDFTQVLQTGLPAGTYCDVITGELNASSCTGKSVVVASDGTTTITISKDDPNGIIAIHSEEVV